MSIPESGINRHVIPIRSKSYGERDGVSLYFRGAVSRTACIMNVNVCIRRDAFYICLDASYICVAYVVTSLVNPTVSHAHKHTISQHDLSVNINRTKASVQYFPE